MKSTKYSNFDEGIDRHKLQTATTSRKTKFKKESSDSSNSSDSEVKNSVKKIKLNHNKSKTGKKERKSASESDTDRNVNNKSNSKITPIKTSTPTISNILAAASLSTKKDLLQKILADSNKTANELIEQKETKQVSLTPKGILKNHNHKNERVIGNPVMKNKSNSSSEDSFSKAISSTQIKNIQNSESDSDSEHNSTILKKNEDTIKNKLDSSAKNVFFNVKKQNSDSSDSDSDGNTVDIKQILSKLKKSNNTKSSSDSDSSDLKNFSQKAQNNDSDSDSDSSSANNTSNKNAKNVRSVPTNKVIDTNFKTSNLEGLLHIKPMKLLEDFIQKQSIPKESSSDSDSDRNNKIKHPLPEIKTNSPTKFSKTNDKSDHSSSSESDTQKLPVLKKKEEISTDSSNASDKNAAVNKKVKSNLSPSIIPLESHKQNMHNKCSSSSGSSDIDEQKLKERKNSQKDSTDNSSSSNASLKNKCDFPNKKQKIVKLSNKLNLKLLKRSSSIESSHGDKQLTLHLKKQNKMVKSPLKNKEDSTSSGSSDSDENRNISLNSKQSISAIKRTDESSSVTSDSDTTKNIVVTSKPVNKQSNSSEASSSEASSSKASSSEASSSEASSSDYEPKQKSESQVTPNKIVSKSQKSPITSKSSRNNLASISDSDSEKEFQEKKITPRKSPIYSLKTKNIKQESPSSSEHSDNQITTMKKIQKMYDPNIVDSKQVIKIDNYPNLYDNLKSYILNNTNLEKLDYKTEFDLNNLSENDEIWVTQCPKQIKPEVLLGQKIKFKNDKPKLKLKINDKKYECISDDSNSKICLLATKGKKLAAKIIKSKGKMTILEVVKDKNKSDIKKTKEVAVELPKNLKVRHPIFGSDFEDKITLEENIQQKLIDAEIHRRKVEAKSQKKRNRKSSVKEEQKDEIIFQLLNETKQRVNTNVDDKKKKSKKRKISNEHNNSLKKTAIDETERKSVSPLKEFKDVVDLSPAKKIKEKDKNNSLLNLQITEEVLQKKKKKKKSESIEFTADKNDQIDDVSSCLAANVSPQKKKKLKLSQPDLPNQKYKKSKNKDENELVHIEPNKKHKKSKNEDENELVDIEADKKHMKSKSKDENELVHIEPNKKHKKSKNEDENELVDIEANKKHKKSKNKDENELVDIEANKKHKKSKSKDKNELVNNEPIIALETSFDTLEMKKSEKQKLHDTLIDFISLKKKHKKSKNIEEFVENKSEETKSLIDDLLSSALISTKKSKKKKNIDKLRSEDVEDSITNKDYVVHKKNKKHKKDKNKEKI